MSQSHPSGSCGEETLIINILKINRLYATITVVAVIMNGVKILKIIENSFTKSISVFKILQVTQYNIVSVSTSNTR